MAYIPAVTDFINALSGSGEAFRTLCRFSVCCRDGRPAVSVTSLFAEARIVMDGSQWLLCAPVRSESAEAANAMLRLWAANRSRGVVPECRLLPDELVWSDSCGRSSCCDLLLERMPEGETLDEAVTHIDTRRLLGALDDVKRRFAEAGVCHRNLKPSNLIFGDDGALHAVRCRYAVAGCTPAEVAAEFGMVEEFIRRHPEVGGSCRTDAGCEKLAAGFDEVAQLCDMMRRVCREGLFGYADADGEVVIEPQFAYAEDFYENRAIVETCGGRMGVIDRTGRYVVEPVYDMIGWTDDDRLRVRLGELTGELDYSGSVTLPLQPAKTKGAE